MRQHEWSIVWCLLVSPPGPQTSTTVAGSRWHTLGILPEGVQKLLVAVQAPIAEAVEDLSVEQQQGLMTYFRSATDAYREGLRQAESG